MPASNPYASRLPVQTSAALQSRQRELQEVVAGLTEARPVHFGVVGGPRMGKTSFLRAVEARLPAMRNDRAFVIAHLDTNELVDPSPYVMLRLVETRLRLEAHRRLGMSFHDDESVVLLLRSELGTL